MSSARANIRGIAAMTLSMAAFAINDVTVKVVARNYPIGETIFIRGCVNVAILAIVITALGEMPKFRQVGQPLVIARSLSDVFVALCFVAALVHINVAELSALYLSAPIIMAGMALVLYREAVGWWRWGGLILGFIGAMFVIKPSIGSFEVWTFVGVAAAVGAAVRELITARIDLKSSTLLIAFAASCAVTLAGLSLAAFEEWRWVTMSDIGFLAMAGAFYSLATILLVVAFRGVEVTVVASFRYTFLLWSGIAAYIVLNEVPDRWAWLGAALIVSSGLYTVHYEAVRRRYASTVSVPQR